MSEKQSTRAPDLRGQWDAWKVPPSNPDVIAQWLIGAQGAHREVTHWVTSICRITESGVREQADREAPGSTHHVVCFAIEPGTPIDMDVSDYWRIHIPAAFSHLGTYPDDATAEMILGRLVERIVIGVLSPNADAQRSGWNTLWRELNHAAGYPFALMRENVTAFIPVVMQPRGGGETRALDCPVCPHKIGLHESIPPAAGDHMLCGGCLGVHRFDAAGKLSPLSSAEYQALHPDTRAHLEAVMADITASKGHRA